MKKLWDGIKTFSEGRGYPILLALLSLGAAAYYLYEPFPTALNAFLVGGDSIPLLLLFDLIGILLVFAIGAVILILRASTWAWFPFVVGALFVLPKLFVLHLVPVEHRGIQLLIAYAILFGILPGIYFGWRIRRAAMEKREEDESHPDKI